MKKGLLILVALMLLGCSKPLPPERSSYVGEWDGPSMALLITQDGRVKYKRFSGGSAKTSIDAPLKEFVGDNFIVGVGPFKTTFVVTRAPHQDGNAWKMTVDGVELTRKTYPSFLIKW